MRLIRGLRQLAELPSGLAVTIGNFDGVHRGHQAVLKAVKQLPSARETAVITFEPHPRAVLAPAAFQPLTVLATKQQLLAAHGLDYLIVLQTTPKLLTTSPAEFWQYVARLKTHTLVVGEDFRFGHNRQGNVNDLTKWSRADGIDCRIVPETKTVVAGETVAVHSQLIRQFLVNGQVKQAIALLGHPYALTGRVVPGAGRGQELGFPTANLTAIETLIPADGVYWAETRIGQGTYQAGLSIGTLPTFGSHPRQVEAHIIDYNGNLNNQILTLSVRQYLRPQKKFALIPQLVTQIAADIDQIRGLAASRDASSTRRS